MDDVIAEFIEKRPNRAAMVSRSRLMTLSNTVIDDIESRKGDPDVVACKVTLEGKRTLREAQRQEQTEVGQMEIEANGLIQRYFEYDTQKLETSMSYNLSNSTDLKSFATNFIRLRNICLFRYRYCHAIPRTIFDFGEQSESSLRRNEV